MNVTLAEAKRVDSQYQKEAEKCNSATEICESARERAEALLLKERKITYLWVRRARQSGWEGYIFVHSQWTRSHRLLYFILDVHWQTQPSNSLFSHSEKNIIILCLLRFTSDWESKTVRIDKGISIAARV